MADESTGGRPIARSQPSESDLNGFRARLADRSRWPRYWWAPIYEPVKTAAPEEWKRLHDETSQTIRRTMLTLAGFCFFSVLTLAAPDISLLSNEASVSLPFANTEISFTAFLFLGPLTLVGQVIYLHIFLGYWKICK